MRLFCNRLIAPNDLDLLLRNANGEFGDQSGALILWIDQIKTLIKLCPDAVSHLYSLPDFPSAPPSDRVNFGDVLDRRSKKIRVRSRESVVNRREDLFLKKGGAIF